MLSANGAVGSSRWNGHDGSECSFILMDRRSAMRENREQECRTMQTIRPKMDEPFLLVFQQRRVSDADMKHAVTVSYLNVSLSGKVRQQLADVLQPAQPLKHISMLIDVRCRLQKHALDLLRSSYPPPPLRFSKLTLHARQMEQGTVKYKQLKLIEERGGGMRERTGESASRKSSRLTNIEFSGRLWKDRKSWLLLFFLQVKAVKDISLCEMETGNELQLF